MLKKLEYVCAVGSIALKKKIKIMLDEKKEIE